MYKFRYGPKGALRPNGGQCGATANIKGKLYAVKISLGEVVLAEGVVEMPSGAECKKPTGSAS
jgi:hypothetical protein